MVLLLRSLYFPLSHSCVFLREVAPLFLFPYECARARVVGFASEWLLGEKWGGGKEGGGKKK